MNIKEIVLVPVTYDVVSCPAAMKVGISIILLIIELGKVDEQRLTGKNFIIRETLRIGKIC
jgi:hypothetical protein